MRSGERRAWRVAVYVRVLALGLAGVSALAGAVCILGLPTAAFAQVDASPALPRRAEATTLVSATLATLNAAILTDDYSLVRSDGAPAFQARFGVDELAAFFGAMREKGIDLSRATAQPAGVERARFHTGQKVLQIVGKLQAEPGPVRYAFSFQSINGHWRIYGLILDLDGAPGSELALAPSS